MLNDLQTKLQKLREAKPLVLCLTNAVSVDLVANSLLALGAAPVMSHDPREAEELTRIASAVYINIGTLDAPFITRCMEAASIAQKEGKPIVLDPVGAGASNIRTQSAEALLPYASIVRGNASEIMALHGTGGKTLGVESTSAVNAAKASAIALAKDSGNTIAISGEEDFVTNGQEQASLTFGSPLMPRVTGMGCALTAIIAAFHGILPNPYEAAHLAMAYVGLCGNIAEDKAKAPGSFRSAFLDALYEADFSAMKTHCHEV